ncbi:hypothetical protein [Mesorhizobium sp. M0802]|uniref:hypothetical protein n=1 Tax=Mesorhizobium sp. M0802 TaxID=2957001 RepID=UPI00333525E7
MSEPATKLPDDWKAERLYELFEGDRNHHGTYDKGLHLVGSKMEMKDETGRGPRDVPGSPTPDLWRQHLGGVVPLGIRPVRADGMCRWGVIDVDGRDVPSGSYGDVRLADVVNEVERANLPLIVCRSKSGGAHLMLFLDDWTPQKTVNGALKVMAAKLGFPRADVFPRADGPGNWLNMPYFEGDQRTNRYAVKAGGLMMTLAEFVAAAGGAQTSHAELVALTRALGSGSRGVRPTNGRAGEAGEERPARAQCDLARYCVEIAAQRQGGRAKLLYGRAKDMGRLIGADWIDEDAVCSALLKAATFDSSTPLPPFEATDHIRRGIADGRKEPPDREEEGGRYPRIESIVVWRGGEETLWEITLAGHGTITLPVKEAMHYWTFNMRCADKLRTSFRQMKADAWNDQIAAALVVAEVLEIPPDETVEGMFRDALREFCMHRHHGDSVEDLMLGKPAHVDDDRRIYFRFEDFHRFLDRKDSGPFRSTKRQVLGRLLAGIGREGVDHGKTTKKLKGVTTEVRWIRSNLFESIDPFRHEDLPPIPGEPI